MSERLLFANNLLLIILLFVSGLMLLAVLNSLGHVLRRIRSDYTVLITDDGPDLHEPFPCFSLQAVSGKWIDNGLFNNRETVLLFLSANCNPCEVLLRTYNQIAQRRGDVPCFLFVVDFPPDRIRQNTARLELESDVIFDPENRFRQLLRITRTPYGLFVDRAGILRMKGVVNHLDHLHALIQRRGRAIGALGWETAPEPFTS